MAVYFIRAGESGPVKIGSADDVAHRIAELQAGNPEPLILLRQIDGGRQTEHFTHRHFKHLRIRGEWFVFDESMLTFVAEFVERPASRLPLDRYLKSAGISKDAFAKKVGVTPEAVRLWCSGRRTPRLKALVAIRDVTNGAIRFADFEPENVAAE